MLRIWNGDCLSNSRLFHYGLAATVGCPRCGEYDSPEHMLVNCVIAKRVWEILMGKILKMGNRSMLHYAIGINDSKANLMVKAEILKYVMHFRDLNPEIIVQRALTYLSQVSDLNIDNLA